MKPTFWLLRGLKFLLLGGLFVALFTLLTQSLWNWLVPPVFHGPALSFLQALGLLALSRLLLGSGLGRPRAGARAQWRRAWQQRVAGRLDSLSPEQQAQFRAQMQHRCSMGWKRAAAGAEAEVAAQ